MSSSLLTLPWLPLPDDQFRAQVKAVKSLGSDEAMATLKRLSGLSANANQLATLAKALRAHQPEGTDLPLSVAILSNATTDLVAPAIEGTAPRFGLKIHCFEVPFGTYAQEIAMSDSGLNTQRRDVVLLALDSHALNFREFHGDLNRSTEELNRVIQRLQLLCKQLLDRGHRSVFIQTFVPRVETVFGDFESALVGSYAWYVNQLNHRLRASVEAGIYVLDLEALANRVGLEHWIDPGQWHLGKFSMSHAAIPLYADYLCRKISALKGKAKKCLVLDLDNTLWGGVIGDDGLEGIVIGQGSAVGEAHLAVQRFALLLRERGVVLAVSSKNTESVARQVFQEHPEMLLKEEHIAVFQANWQDKASNLKAIAKALNIGVDSLVLLDDNPAERQQVRSVLPEVGVPELPSDPALFPRMLLAAGYFETIGFTQEDLQRAAQYQANVARESMLSDATDMSKFLESLNMEAQVSPFDAIGRARTTQLINKTNQFNLTTKRYTETEVMNLEKDVDAVTFQIRLKDAFGDNGMICVLIGRFEAQALHVDTWLMSCRVLNRRVEEFSLSLLVDVALKRGVNKIMGTYFATEKNVIVKDLYSKLGFKLVENIAGGSQWALDLATYARPVVPIRIAD
jgi:FkbH-like protein